jgi:hypothetical protein
LKLNSAALLLLACICQPLLLLAQGPQPKEASYKGYYIFPVQPGQPNFLSGTMGELRGGHFHGGLDIRTGGVTGYPIHATADGYVSRVKVSTSGYGNVIYLAHPNGTTSVYAHLENFEPGLAKWVREQQYRDKTFEIELFPEQNQFRYKQRDVIGNGGNSGSSGGPHLHFEIRDANQNALNPLEFGFDEIKDNIPPTLHKMALEPKGAHSRVGHEYGRFEYKPLLQNGHYKLSGNPIPAWGQVGVEISAIDKLNGSDFNNGFPLVEMLVNGQPVYAHNVNKFSFDITRHIEIHTNYGVRKRTGNKFMRLYKVDGNELNFYKTGPSGGLITIDKADSLYNVLIKMTDSHGNVREMNFQLKGEEPKTELAQLANNVGQKPELYENLLLFSAAHQKGTPTPVVVYANRRQYELAPAYVAGAKAIYFWDMRQGLPDSAQAGGNTRTFNFKATVPSQTAVNLYLPEMDLAFPRNSLFDTLYLETDYRQEGTTEVFTISEDVHPLFTHITASLKPQVSYELKDKTHVYEIKGKNSWGWAGGQWHGDKITFRTRTLGQFTLLTDTSPPTIRPIRANSSSLAFRIADDLSGIRSFDVWVEGEWLLMYYDHKRSLIWSEKLDESKPLKGAVEVRVKDNAGNEQVYNTKIP